MTNESSLPTNVGSNDQLGIDGSLRKHCSEPISIEEAMSARQNATGLCTVRALAAHMEESKVSEVELYFESDGKRWNVELHITRCEVIPMDRHGSVVA